MFAEDEFGHRVKKVLVLSLAIHVPRVSYRNRSSPCRPEEDWYSTITKCSKIYHGGEKFLGH